jgi:hypothetical protein
MTAAPIVSGNMRYGELGVLRLVRGKKLNLSGRLPRGRKGQHPPPFVSNRSLAGKCDPSI